MGAISEEVFSTSASPGAFCLNCRFLGGALSVSPFSALTGAYQSSLGVRRRLVESERFELSTYSMPLSRSIQLELRPHNLHKYYIKNFLKSQIFQKISVGDPKR